MEPSSQPPLGPGEKRTTIESDTVSIEIDRKRTVGAAVLGDAAWRKVVSAMRSKATAAATAVGKKANSLPIPTSPCVSLHPRHVALFCDSTLFGDSIASFPLHPFVDNGSRSQQARSACGHSNTVPVSASLAGRLLERGGAAKREAQVAKKLPKIHVPAANIRLMLSRRSTGLRALHQVSDRALTATAARRPLSKAISRSLIAATSLCCSTATYARFSHAHQYSACSWARFMMWPKAPRASESALVSCVWLGSASEAAFLKHTAFGWPTGMSAPAGITAAI